MEVILCKMCGKRRAKRACPAVQGDICTLCCGTEREVSLACPLECQYLQEAHRHEKPVVVGTEISKPGVEVTEEFLQSHEELLLFIIHSLVQAALEVKGAVDSDVLSALEALVQTHQTLESGLVYETRAGNSVAASVQRSFAASLKDYEKRQSEREGFARMRNADVLAILVFLHRLGRYNQNGRPRGRMYLDLLRHMIPEQPVKEGRSSIIL